MTQSVTQNNGQQLTPREGLDLAAPELRAFWGDSLTKPPFGVTSAEVAIICPDIILFLTRIKDILGGIHHDLEVAMRCS